MMGEHTPGPWIYHSGGVYRSKPVDANGWATVRVATPDRDQRHTPATECDANAQLIALAPELDAYRKYIEDTTDRLRKRRKSGWVPVCFAEFRESEECENYLMRMWCDQ
jgi:hypothetical protein